jgi:hypothetical protein
MRMIIILASTTTKMVNIRIVNDPTREKFEPRYAINMEHEVKKLVVYE